MLKPALTSLNYQLNVHYHYQRQAVPHRYRSHLAPFLEDLKNATRHFKSSAKSVNRKHGC